MDMELSRKALATLSYVKGKRRPIVTLKSLRQFKTEDDFLKKYLLPVGKALIQCVTVSVRTNSCLNPPHGGMWENSNCQSTPVYVPLYCTESNKRGSLEFPGFL